MCITNISEQRLNDSVIKYKFLQVVNEKLYSPSETTFRWLRSNTADLSSSYATEQTGFHVFLTKEEAVNAAKIWQKEDSFWGEKAIRTFVVVELECEDFLRAGIITSCDSYSNGHACEIWATADVKNVFTLQGENVTEKYFPVLTE